MGSFLKNYHGTIIGICFVAIWMLIFVLVSIFWTWGEVSYCATEYEQCFCEHVDTSQMVAAPMNAWSNFYYIGAGMLILIYYDLERNNRVKKREDYLSQEGNLHYLLTYGLLVTWIGIGSFLMHAARRGQTGYLDVLSMNMYISGIFIISMSVLFDLRQKYVYPILISTFVCIAIIMRYIGGVDIFTFWVGFTFVNEVLVGSGVYSRLFKNKARQVKRNLLLLILGVGTFLFAYYIWHFGQRGHPLCDPYSWWQWHALWHFLTAVSTIILAFYMRTEKEIKR